MRSRPVEELLTAAVARSLSSVEKLLGAVIVRSLPIDILAKHIAKLLGGRT